MIDRTCHAVASRLAVALRGGWLAKADPYEFAMYYDV